MKKPIVLVIMDGVGRGDGGPGDAVKLANTPNLDRLFATCPHNWLKAASRLSIACASGAGSGRSSPVIL